MKEDVGVASFLIFLSFAALVGAIRIPLVDELTGLLCFVLIITAAVSFFLGTALSFRIVIAATVKKEYLQDK